MNRVLTFFFFLLFSSGPAGAQNWQCLQPGVKHYFTNSNGYLRGIRIDSVKTYADSVVYYPFHTPRGAYYSSAGSTTLDSTGGSWLGKRVQQLNDGTFLFDNLWGDTVVIKTSANVGDSWIFCRDTSSLFYRADLIAADTLTVLGSLDSVKTILITARSSSGVVATDPVDSFRIIFSKNNGFVQVCDLYTFPYHKPDSGYVPGLDVFLDKSGTKPYQAYSFIGFPPSSDISLFSLISLVNPTGQQLYDFSIGDVFQYKECFDPNGVGCDVYYPVADFCSSTYDADSITYKIATADSTTYYFTGGTSYNNPFYLNRSGVQQITLRSSLLIDTTLMPEEFKQNNVVYYYPLDTNYCMSTPFYDIVPSYVRGAESPFYFEGPTFENTYKIGLGQIKNCFEIASTDFFQFIISELVFHKNSSGSCGNFHIVSGVPSLNKGNSYHFFPNPANEELTIKTAAKQAYTVTLINALGQPIKTISTTQQQQTIKTSNLPAGVYTITVTDEDGNRYTEKVVIVH